MNKNNPYTLAELQMINATRGFLYLPSEEEVLKEKIYAYNKVIEFCKDNNIYLYTPDEVSNFDIYKYYITENRDGDFFVEETRYGTGPTSDSAETIIKKGEHLFAFKNEEDAKKVLENCYTFINILY